MTDDGPILEDLPPERPASPKPRIFRVQLRIGNGALPRHVHGVKRAAAGQLARLVVAAGFGIGEGRLAEREWVRGRRAFWEMRWTAFRATVPAVPEVLVS